MQTLRAYIDMLRMEDRLYAHPTYLKARAGQGTGRGAARWPRPRGGARARSRALAWTLPLPGSADITLLRP